MVTGRRAALPAPKAMAVILAALHGRWPMAGTPKGNTPSWGSALPGGARIYPRGIIAVRQPSRHPGNSGSGRPRPLGL